jgi:hypothetical protein
MSKLNKFMRPVVEFDPKDDQHRAWAHEGLTSNAWGKIPVRFTVSEEALNIHYTIERQLLEYYMGLEFGKGRRKSGKLALAVNE